MKFITLFLFALLFAACTGSAPTQSGSNNNNGGGAASASIDGNTCTVDSFWTREAFGGTYWTAMCKVHSANDSGFLSLSVLGDTVGTYHVLANQQDYAFVTDGTYFDYRVNAEFKTATGTITVTSFTPYHARFDVTMVYLGGSHHFAGAW